MLGLTTDNRNKINARKTWLLTMKLNPFTLDREIQSATADIPQEYFFYIDSNKILSAWILTHKSNGRVDIRTYKEFKEGIMTMHDLIQLDTPTTKPRITADGQVVLQTQKGKLQANVTNNKIEIRSSRIQPQEKKNDTHETLSIFQGMKTTDRHKFDGYLVSRLETISQDFYGDSFFFESILLRSEIAQHPAHPNSAGSDQGRIILQGSCKIDDQLNFVPCNNQAIFDFPIQDFIIQQNEQTGPLYLIGWNRHRLQSVELKQPSKESRRLSTETIDQIIFENNVNLKDKSTQYCDTLGRLAILVDAERPNNFYRLN